MNDEAFEVVLLESDPNHSLGSSCLRDLYHITQYLYQKKIPVRTVNVFTSRRLTLGQRSKFAIPRVSINFHTFNKKQQLVTQLKKLCNRRLFVLISGHGGQIPDIGGDELDGKDEYIPTNFGHLLDDELTTLFTSNQKQVICVVDTCHSGSMIDLNYIYADGEWKKNTSSETKKEDVYYIGACHDHQVAYCGIGDILGYGGNLTISLIEHDILSSFLHEVTLKNLENLYNKLKPVLEISNQHPSIQINILES